MSSLPFPYLKEFVYGGIDGCVTTFAVVAGATGASLDPGVIIVLGFPNLSADGFSMSVGNYLSVKSEIKNVKNARDKSPLQTAVATFISFIIMGIIPLAAYVVDYLQALNVKYLFLASTILTAVAFLCNRNLQ